VQNSPAQLPDVGLGPRVGLPGRRQPAGYGTSWSVLVSSTSGRPFPSSTDLLLPFFPRTSSMPMCIYAVGVYTYGMEDIYRVCRRSIRMDGTYTYGV